MKSWQKVLALILLCQVLVQNSSDLQAATPFVMPNSAMHPISTDSTRNKDYLLYVHLPENYKNENNTKEKNAKNKHYPVLYLLDPWWDFPVVAGAHSGLVFDGVIPELIIVGIGYAAENPNVDRLRESDYTPAPVAGDKNMGDGKAFLTFIESSIIPYVEETYRVDKRYRVLAGSSYGGLFTLFTLFEKPALFQGHIAISPAVSWFNRWLFRREAEFYLGNNTGKIPTLESRLYMSVGDADQLENFTNESIAFSYLLKDRPYKGLDYKFEIRANEHHASVKLGSFSQGLAHAFSGYAR